MHKALSSLFWDFYAFCYDGVRELKPYQEMLEQVLAGLDLKPGMRVLDAGCGTGNLEALISERYPDIEVVAVDFSRGMLHRAKKKCTKNSAFFLQADLNWKLPFQEDSFDRIVCVNALYNLKDQEKTLAEFNRVLRPSGVLVLTTSKKGNSPGLVLKAHGEASGNVAGAGNTSFLSWMQHILKSFGTARILFRMVLLMLCNKVLLQTMREFEINELAELAKITKFSVLEVGLTYAEQGILLRTIKSEIRDGDVIYKIALTDAEKNASFKLRYDGYCRDMRGIDEKYCPNGLERDEYDDDAIHFIAIEGDRVIGTLRLIPVRGNKMPMEEFFIWPNLVPRSQVLEGSRLYVVRDKRGGANVMAGLFKFAFEYSKGKGYRYWCFASLPVPARIMKKWGWKMWIFGEEKQVKIPTAENFIAEFTPIIVELCRENVPFPNKG